MSYTRFADDSDVYVFLCTSGFLECCACSLNGEDDRFTSTDAILAHLEEHHKAGHKVPPSCAARLERNRRRNDSYIAHASSDDSAPRSLWELCREVFWVLRHPKEAGWWPWG